MILPGSALPRGGSTLYLAGRGAGAATWGLSAGAKSQKLPAAFSAEKDQVSEIAKEPGHDDRSLRMSQHLGGRFANTCHFAFVTHGSIASC